MTDTIDRSYDEVFLDALREDVARLSRFVGDNLPPSAGKAQVLFALGKFQGIVETTVAKFGVNSLSPVAIALLETPVAPVVPLVALSTEDADILALASAPLTSEDEA